MARFTAILLVAMTCVACFATVSASSADTERAEKFRDAIPRFGPSEFDQDDSDYLKGIVILAVVPAVFAALTLLVALFFCVCRCCGCCVYKPKEEGYPNNKRYIPLLLLLAFAAVAFAFSSVGQAESERLSTTLADKDSTDSFSSIVERLISDTVQWLQDLSAPLTVISNEIGPTIDEVRRILDDTVDTVQAGTDGLVQRLDQTSANLDGLTITTPSRTYTCDYCSTVSTQVQDISNEIDAQTGQSIADFRQTIDDVAATLVDVRDDIVTQAGDVNQTIYEQIGKADDAQELSDDILDKVDTHDQQRFTGTLVLFLIPMGAFIVIVLASLCKSSKLFKVVVWVSFLSMFFMWLLLAVHLPLAIVLADVCVKAEDDEAEIIAEVPTVNTTNIRKIMRACLLNGTVVDALNLTSELDFANQIEFPTDYNLTQEFDFATLDTFKSDVDALTLDTFGWDDAYIQTPLDNMNAALGTYYTRDNISSLDPLTYPAGAQRDAATTGKTLTEEALTDRAVLNDTLTEMRSNVSDLVDYKNSVRDELIVAQNNITGMETLADPFIVQANILIDESRCLFLADYYHELKDATCVRVMNHVSVLAMSLFFIALVSTPIIILSQVSASRWPRPFDETKIMPSISSMEMAQESGGGPPGGGVGYTDPSTGYY